MGVKPVQQLFKVIEEIFTKPPIKFEAEKHSLKAWAMYCLRDKGFKVVYAEKADFAVEPRNGEKIYFKVTNSSDNLDNKLAWIVWDNSTNSAKVIAPQQ
ncbi:hypothetical protein NDI37_09465 [Funiculus sociatus GB2-A5]|jgi:hypothetical protein|uniref:Uncharacterized protein n=1 Tax=Funiculus sociatus GB2-A5 TaxID=2933946 RepID=A0ABV0JMS5_9CYAN|nr:MULTISPECIES: hypothetical protein [unclassified Trichocoleus]MBD1905845.1 hypothetical protein [Trichocoleus sp. FACHB-832]MBD2065404.1 hypothetical protein [Trichocoleus sp. FACHB-6]